MVDHQRQNDGTDQIGRKKRRGNGQPAGKAFGGPAVEQHRAIRVGHPRSLAKGDHRPHAHGQKQPDHGEKQHQRGDGDRRPKARDCARAESRVDDQHDRPAVHDHGQQLVALHKPAHQRTQHLPDDERQQDLHADFADGIQTDAAVALMQQQGHQHRRQNDPDEVGDGRRADRRRHIAARNRGEGDRGLHGRGQHRQKQQPHGHRRPEDRAAQRRQQQANQRKQHIGRAKGHPLQAPICDASLDRAWVQLGPIKKEQQRDGPEGHPAQAFGGDTCGRQHNARDHGGQQQDHIGVDADAFDIVHGNACVVERSI